MITDTSHPQPNRPTPGSRESESLADFFENLVVLVIIVAIFYFVVLGVYTAIKVKNLESRVENMRQHEPAAEDSEEDEAAESEDEAEEPLLMRFLEHLLSALTPGTINHDWSLSTLTMKKYDVDGDIRYFNDSRIEKLNSVLQKIADSQLDLFDHMQPVKISTEPDLMAYGAYGTFRFAGPQSETQEGLKAPEDFEDLSPSIKLDVEFVLYASVFDVYEVILHELTHAWVHDGPGAEACYDEGQGMDEHGGHCSLFLEKAMSLGLEVGSEVNVFSSVFWTYARLKFVRGTSRLSTLDFWSLIHEAKALLTGEGQRPPNTFEQLEKWPHFPRQFLEWL